MPLLSPPSPGHPWVVRVGAAAAGAGSSTVALAVAGLLAWRGLATLAVGAQGLVALCSRAGWEGPGAVELARLPVPEVGAELGRVARGVAGVRGLAVLGGLTGEVPFAGWPLDAVVVDVGDRVGAADLVVVRPDAGLRVAARLDVPVVLNAAGPVPDRVAAAALRGRVAARLPWSARVARAGSAGRVPSALPGRWLAGLEPVVGR